MRVSCHFEGGRIELLLVSGTDAGTVLKFTLLAFDFTRKRRSAGSKEIMDEWKRMSTIVDEVIMGHFRVGPVTWLSAGEAVARYGAGRRPEAG